MAPNLLAKDLNYILEKTSPLFENLRNQRIFITGGTGFFGCWLLESFIWANDFLGLNAKAVVLTRNVNLFEKKCPHLFHHPAIQFHVGDVRNFKFPEGQFTHIIHAATEASAALNESNPLLMLDTILEGTKHVLEMAKCCGTKRFLLTSSGAVYGKQPHDVTHLKESHPCKPDLMDPKSAYAIGKCTAEHMVCLYGKQYGFESKIARCFAFIGPYLPLDTHYAIGNFIRDSLKGNIIHINGDGTPFRSYLYAADLTIWLWTILFNGQTGQPYNVGSDQAYTIAEIAQMVANHFEPSPEIVISQKPTSGGLPARYVPDVTLIQTQFKLQPPITLEEAITRTVKWNTYENY